MLYKKFKFIIGCNLEKTRFDKVITLFFKRFTRTQINRLIRSGFCCIDDFVTTKPGVLVKRNSIISVKFFCTGNVFWYGINFYLDIIYEDLDLIVLNKSNGLIIHPSTTSNVTTLINYLLFMFPFLNCVPRAGIVHRLDKDTTGIVVVVKNLKSYYNLVLQFKLRIVEKIYTALVCGNLGNKVMSLFDKVLDKDKSYLSLSYFRLIYTFSNGFKYVRVYPKTGRKHQIRKHLLTLNCPIVGDYFYGFLLPTEKTFNSKLFSYLKSLDSIMLHSNQIIFLHPTYKRFIFFESMLPKHTKNMLYYLYKTF